MTREQMRRLDRELSEYMESMVEDMGRSERHRALEWSFSSFAAADMLTTLLSRHDGLGRGLTGQLSATRGTGTPKQLLECRHSITAEYLRRHLQNARAGVPAA